MIQLRSRGRTITAAIEIANGGAAGIDPATLALTDGRRRVSPSRGVPPRLDDADADGNADLVAKFDRDAVAKLLRPHVDAGRALLHAVWESVPGIPGRAVAAGHQDPPAGYPP